MFTAPVARAHLLTIRAIRLGKILGVGLIWCSPCGCAGHHLNRPVQWLTGAPPCDAVVEDVSGEEIEGEGFFCDLSAAHRNSIGTYFQLPRTPGTFPQDRQRGRARAPFCPSWAAWAGFGPGLFLSFPFSFISRAKTIIKKYRKMVKL
jgi:hypothetical protein